MSQASAAAGARVESEQLSPRSKASSMAAKKIDTTINQSDNNMNQKEAMVVDE